MRAMRSIICIGIFIAMGAMNALGQKISGRVIDEAGDGISYVSIGILNSTTGTISDRQGYFTLTLPDNLDAAEELFFRHISYELQSVPISEIKGNKLDIRMTTASHVIEEVMVFGGKMKEYKFTSKGMRIPAGFFAPSKVGSEIGSIIEVKGKIALSRIDFNISENPFDRARIRINVYRVNSDLPDLNNENMEEETDDSQVNRAELIKMAKNIVKEMEQTKKINIIDSALLVNMLHVPIYCDIPTSKKTQDFSVSPNENVILNSGRYYISLEVVELEGEGNCLLFPAFLHKSYIREHSMGGIKKLPVNVGLVVRGYKLSGK